MDDVPALERGEAAPAGEEATAKPAADLGAAARMASLRVALFGAPVEPVRVGRFVLLDTLGAGGMGVVYAAYDPHLDRRVALKLVRAEASGSAGSEARLLREAQAMARLSHPNVVQIHEAGLWEDRVFLAMELVAGQTLTAWVAAEPRRWRDVVRIFVEAGRGLAAAHAVGIVHRDFKPDNVLVGDDGRVRVTDFGLARGGQGVARALDAGPWMSVDPEVAAIGPALTASGALAGTPAYMSPEQLRGEPATAASDQFSFCVALYHALHGLRPFAGEDRQELARAVLEGELQEPPRLGAPRRIHRALRRGLALAAADRFPTIDALLGALTAARSRWLAGGSAAALAGVAATLALSLGGADPCGDGGGLLDGVWDAERREAVRRAYVASSVADSEVLWASTASSIDGYADSVRSVVGESCRDQRGGLASPALHDLRVRCLRRHLAVAREIVNMLAGGESEALLQGPEAAAGLDEPVDCRDERALLLGIEPAPAAKASAADAITDTLAEARAAELLGALAESERLSDDALIEARAVGYAPTLAEALFQRARLAVLARDFAGASELLREALTSALRARHDRLVSEVWPWRIKAEVMGKSAVGRAREWLDEADAWFERQGGSPLQRADLEQARSLVAAVEGALAEAEAASAEALSIRLAELGEGHFKVAIARINHGNHLAARGRLEASIGELRAAVATLSDLLGDRHIVVADAQYNLAASLVEVGSEIARGEAERLFMDAQAIVREGRGDGALELADGYIALANLAHGRGADDEAEAHVAAALAVYDRHPRHPDRVYGLIARSTLMQARGDHRAAIASLREARSIAEAAHGAASPIVGELDARIVAIEHAEGLIPGERAIEP